MKTVKNILLKKQLKIVFSILFLLQTSLIYGATRTASVAGNWNNTATWGGASVPSASDDVTINVAVTLDVDAQCKTITISSGLSGFTMGNYNLTVFGTATLNCYNQTPITTTGGYFIMDGTNGASAINSSGNCTLTIPNLRLTNNANVSFGNNNQQITVTNFDCQSGTNSITNSCASNNGGPFKVTGSLTAPNCSFNVTNINVNTSAFDFSGITNNPGQIGGVTINQSGSTFTFGSKNIDVYGTLAYSAGTFTNSGVITMQTGSSLNIGATLTIASLKLGASNISKSGAGALTITAFNMNSQTAFSQSAGTITSGAVTNTGSMAMAYSGTPTFEYTGGGAIAGGSYYNLTVKTTNATIACGTTITTVGTFTNNVNITGSTSAGQYARIVNSSAIVNSGGSAVIGASSSYLAFSSTISSSGGGSVGGNVLQSSSQAATCTPPTVTVSAATLSSFSYCLGSGPSSTQTYSVSGSNLTANITITPPTDYQISSDNSNWVSNPSTITLTQSGGTVNSTTIYVRLKSGLSVNTYNSETLSNASSGASTQNISCSGSVITTPAAAGTITGTATVVQGQTGVVYSVSAISGATGYTWALPSNASITAGTNTNSITVTYASNASSGNVTVYGTNTCGNGTVSSNFGVTVAPLLTAAGGATVDAAFNVTFTDNSAWRSAITSITVGGSTLSAGYSVSSGQITFTPSTSSPAALLQSNGTKSIVVIATGYANTTVSQSIGVGVANKLAMSVQPAAPALNSAVLGTQPVVLVQDQYGNTTTSTATVVATATSGLWNVGGTTSKAAVSGTATFTNVTSGYSSAVNNATITFTSTGLTSVTSSTFNIPAPPAIVLASASQISSGNISQSATKNALSAFTLAVSTSNAQLNSLVFTSAGTYAAADVTKFQLWYNSSNDLSTATQIGSDITSSLGAGSHTFSGLTQLITSGSTAYLWITTDVAGLATLSNTINIASIATTDITFLSSSKSGSITAGGAQTIQVPVSIIALASPSQSAAAIIGRNWTSIDIASFTLATTIQNTTLTQIDFTTTGSVVNADLSNMKLWYNTTNTLNGATQLGSNITSSMGAGSHSFTSLNHTLTSGTTEYYWITIDVSATATNAATITVSAFTTSNFTASGTKSGSTTAGGTQTIATPVTYYSRVNNGSWSTAATWSTASCGGAAAGAYPTAVDIVNICNTYNVTMSANQACADLIIASGATLSDGGFTLSVGGNITNNGTYSGTGKISLTDGHAEHQVTSTNDNTFYKLELNDTWGAVVSNSAGSIKTTTISNLVLSSGIFRIGDLNNGAVYNKLTFTNAFTISSGATFKLGGDCSGDIIFNGAITVASGGSWTGTAGKTCSSVKMNAAFTNSSAAQTDNSSSTYIIANNSITMDGGNGMNIYNLTSLGVNSSLSGTWTVRNALSTAQFKLNANAVLYLKGTATSSGDWVQCSSSATVHFATNGMTLLPQQYICIVQIDNGVTVNLPSGTFQPRTNLIMDTSSVINVTSSGAIDYQCGYTLRSGSKIYINNGTTPNNFNTYTSTYNSGSSFEFGNNGGSYSLTMDPTKHPFGNFIMDNASSASTITILNDASTSGSLTIGSNVTLTTNGNSRNITIGGDFTNNGTLDVSTNHIGTITLNGSSAQAIGGSTTTTFKNLTINNTSTTGVTLIKPVTVTGALTLTDGLVYTTASNLLTLGSSATATSGSDASHVEGPMDKIGNTAFIFPIGKSGIWARLGFTPSSGFDATTEMSAEYFKTASTNSSNLGTGIHNVSKIEYWDITRVSDPSNDASCNVTLYFEDLTRSGISGNGTDLKTVHYESNLWTDKGGTFTKSGNTGTLVSSTPLTTYSPETAGSTDGSSSLPIVLSNFEANVKGINAVIYWTTASEINNHFFTLERSSDGENWEQIYTCDGAGTSTINHSYSYFDYDTNDLNGTVYYRLKQTDIDGTTSISEVKTLLFKTDVIEFKAYPNPAKSDEMMLYIKTANPEIVGLTIIDVLGSKMCEGKIELTDKQIKIKLSEICKLSPGVYNVLLKGKTFVKNEEIIIQ